VTDCNFDRDVCDIFRPSEFPFILFVKENKIYRYKGSLAIEDLLKYLSADNYITDKNSTIQTENLKDLVAMIEGSSDLYSRLMRYGADLTKWSETHSKTVFKKIQLSHWSENSKMISFALFVLGAPTVLFTYVFLYICIWTQTKVKNLLCDKSREHQHHHLKQDWLK